MSVEMKVIETKFKGTLYRSRVEARWAMFFNILEIPFDYEPEAFVFGNTAYLPDFLLPIQNCYVEIKGMEPTEAEERKARALAEYTGIKAYIFWGSPRLPNQGREYTESAKAYFPDGAEDSAYWWCQCPHCGLLGIEFNGRSYRLPCKCSKSKYNYDSEPLRRAYEVAFSFRFDEWRNT